MTQRLSSIKWERSYPFKQNNNIISSDFSKFQPIQWKCLEGPTVMKLLMSNEYQRLWIKERNAWSDKMFPENIGNKVDLVKRYVLTFKTAHQPPKPVKKKPFKIKKFDKIKKTLTTTRPPNDKAIRQK